MSSTPSNSFRGVARQCDRDFYERELATFIPPRVFDAHCHLWYEDEVPFRIPGYSGDVGADEYLRLVDELHPGREMGALFLSYAIPTKPAGRDRTNEMTGRETAKNPRFRGEFFIRPDDDPEWVRQEVHRLKLHGLKCYHTFSASKPTWESSIPEFLPERLVQLAHEEGWVITLHMVKSRAVADRENYECIRRYCEQYPNMKLILAHSARGFQPAHNLEGLPHLKGLDNLYFDTSANCEPIAHQAIIRILGHDKLMYGSDLPISHMRGRSLSAADSFLWLYEETPVWGEKHSKIDPVLIGLEHLRSVKWACWSERLTDSQIEDVFWNNAAKLLNVR
ncbi:MAG: amidohydrolase family protein [Planctomycetota bacterium]|nr:amidohydrolase family protein [Planctomycetota bacterium]